MKNPLKLLKRLFNRNAEPDEVIASDALPEQEPENHGRVVRELKRAEYSPNMPRMGGRVVKAMPRELRKIKEAQEKVENETEM